ncbi:hypothetical protein [Sessilibacter corallicola]|uniref:Molecular chaperone DnaJ n=1 Tax=Sessilibacter corallicola TaxID=2904075 RepID=A0ABQ0A632_9GAMM
MLPIIRRSKRSQKSRINACWQELKRARAEVEQFESVMSQIRGEFYRVVLPKEKRVLLPHRVALIERLTEFMGRKSLSEWHRQELAGWISLEIDAVSLVDYPLSLALTEKYNQVIHELYPDVPAEDSSADEASAGGFNEASERLAYERILEQLKLGLSEEQLQELIDAFEYEQQKQADDVLSANNKFDARSDVGDGKWLRDLFRRVTNKLHPDREQEAELKLQKQQVLAELLSARDNGDIATMLEIIAENLSEQELNNAALDIEQVEQALAAQIDHCKSLKSELIYHSELSHYLYQSFYSSDTNVREQKFSDYLDNIDVVAERLQEMLEFLKNLTRLKEILQIRNKKNNLLYADDLFGGFGSKDVDGLF